MRRLMAAFLAVGLLTGAIIALSNQGASASLRPHLKVATLALGKSTNLKNGQLITVKGSGFTPKVAVDVLECNLDAAETVDEDACDLGTAKLNVAVNTSGDFTIDFTIAEGNINKAGDGAKYSYCPQSQLQVQHGVTCDLLAIDYEDSPVTEAAITPLWFAPPAPKVKLVKSGNNYNAEVTVSGAYKTAAVAGIGGVGGFAFWGTSGTGGSGTQLCQGNSTGTSTWPSAGFPLCKSSVGEAVKIYVGPKMVHQMRVSTSGATTGGLVYTIKKVAAGTHTLKIVGDSKGIPVITDTTTFKVK